MKDSDYYPAGTYLDPDAPYNEPYIPEKDFDVCISQSLSKSTTISTNQYQPEYEEETGHTYANTENTDWLKAYNDCAMTPLEIIQKCGILSKALLSQGVVKLANIRLKELAEECDGWTDDETEVMEE